MDPRNTIPQSNQYTPGSTPSTDFWFQQQMQVQQQANVRMQQEQQIQQQMQVQQQANQQYIPQMNQPVPQQNFQQPTPEQIQQAKILADQQKIQYFLEQQDRLKKQYDSIVSYLKQNPNVWPELIQSYKTQLEQLNNGYLQIDMQLKSLWYGIKKVNKPTEVKQWAKTNFSFKKLAVWCSIFLLLIAAWFGLAIYTLIQDPDAFLWLGIKGEIAKSILTIFSGLFFGIFLLIGLWLLISNIYKMITVKNQSKGKFIWGIFLALLIFGIFWWWMGFTFLQIGKIQIVEKAVSTQIVDSFIVGIWDKKTEYLDQIPLIAPSQLAFRLNGNILLSQAAKNLGEVEILGVSLNCGNEKNQIIAYNQEQGLFNGYCLYHKKWTYNVTLKIDYRNNLTNEKQNVTIPVRSFDFQGEVILSLAGWWRLSPSENGEFNLGKAPSKLTIDSSSIFRDFWLAEYHSLWDMDWDETYDREDRVSFDYTYKVPKIFYPTFKFPDLSDFVYTFPIRVEQSDVPLCDISLYPIEKTKYKIQTTFLDGVVSNIANYSYSVINSATNAVIDNKKEKVLEYSYTFPDVWNYYVRLDFVTIDGKKGRCESDYIQFDTEKLTFDYEIESKPSWETKYQKVTPQNNTIILDQIPNELNFRFKNISSSKLSVQKKLFLDWEAIINDGDLYHFSIKDNENHILRIELEDTENDLKAEKILNIEVNTPDIICNLSANPDQWFEKLKVSLDASNIKLKDSTDSVMYFSFDFGDGEKKENINNGIISHSYVYDYSNENGEYRPKVKVQTRKWLTCEKQLDIPILVKKNITTLEISSESHPTQIAKVGDTVHLIADFNGLPEKMTWDFGDNSPEQSCKGRSCTEVDKVFDYPGDFKITLTLDFDDSQTVTDVLAFRIQ